MLKKTETEKVIDFVAIIFIIGDISIGGAGPLAATLSSLMCLFVTPALTRSGEGRRIDPQSNQVKQYVVG